MVTKADSCHFATAPSIRRDALIGTKYETHVSVGGIHPVTLTCVFDSIAGRVAKKDATWVYHLAPLGLAPGIFMRRL